jgi:subtilisin family serine protease
LENLRKTLLIIFLLAMSSVAIYSVEAEPEEGFAPNELIVGVENISSPVLYDIESSGGNILELIPSLSAIRVSVAYSMENAFVTAMKSKQGVRYVERNHIYKALYTPNDPYWSYQWDMQIIQADLAWDIHKGSTSVIIAIIDTGIEYTHDDLSAHYVALGYDWVNNDNDPMDDNGHGTHCAGIAAAVMDNNIGVAGVAQVSIMAEKVLSADGSGTADDVAQGIVHAADAGAKVISISLGSYFSSKVVKDACQYAWNKGSILVGAAGNDNVRWRHYPAAYSTVIAVSATDQYDGKASYSNYGNWIELSAPGGDGEDYQDWILSTYLNNWYAWGAGTSQAAPHVSGVAALVWSYESSLTNQELREHLRNTADDLGDPGKDIYYGYGRINAYRALNELGPPSKMHVESIDFKQKGPKSLDIMVTIYDNAGSSVAGATVYMDIEYPDASVYQVTEVTEDKGVATHKISQPAKGTYTVTVTNVTHATLTYDPSANKETTDSYTVT